MLVQQSWNKICKIIFKDLLKKDTDVYYENAKMAIN
jgi:hypothetical protein